MFDDTILQYSFKPIHFVDITEQLDIYDKTEIQAQLAYKSR